MNREEALKLVIGHIVALAIRNKIPTLEVKEMNESSNLCWTLNLDSLDITELIIDLEHTLGISIPDNETDVKTIGEVATLIIKHHEQQREHIQ